MKKMQYMVVLGVVLLSSSVLWAELEPAVAKGDTFEQVVSKLGTPKGKVAGGRKTTFYYDRGTVDFVNGRVERSFLVTQEEAAAKIAAREKAEEDQRKQAEADRARRLTDGKAELERALADKSLVTAPPGVRLAFWEDLQKKYPEVDVTSQIAQARKELDSAQKDDGKLAEVIALNKRAKEIDERFKQLDKDYAASLANWKRTEIDQERVKLTNEINTIKARVVDLLK